MNDHDRENLNFLMSVDRKTLQDWFDSVTPDDIDYAWQLLLAYSTEIEERSMALLDQALATDSQSTSFPEAVAVLEKFRLKK